MSNVACDVYCAGAQATDRIPGVAIYLLRICLPRDVENSGQASLLVEKLVELVRSSMNHHGRSLGMCMQLELDVSEPVGHVK